MSVGDDYRQVTIPVAEPSLRREVKQFRHFAEQRTTNEFLDPGQRLYDLLFRPVDAMLAGRGVDTLVVVPDGVLRTIPFAALHDGKGFLIERYALATAPGLRLVASRPVTPEARQELCDRPVPKSARFRCPAPRRVRAPKESTGCCAGPFCWTKRFCGLASRTSCGL